MRERKGGRETHTHREKDRTRDVLALVDVGVVFLFCLSVCARFPRKRCAAGAQLHGLCDFSVPVCSALHRHERQLLHCWGRPSGDDVPPQLRGLLERTPRIEFFILPLSLSLSFVILPLSLIYFLFRSRYVSSLSV